MFKNNKNQKYASIAYYAFIVIALSVLLIFSLINISSIWDYVMNLVSAVTAFIYGFAIAYICNPIYKWFHNKVFKFTERKKSRPKLRKTISLVSTYLLFFLVVLAFIFALIPSITNNINSLISNIGGYIENIQSSLDNFFHNISIDIPMLRPDNIMEFINGLIYDENGNLLIGELLFPTLSSIFSIGVGVVQHIVYFIIGLILSVYFLMYKHSMIAKVRKLSCAIFPKKVYIWLSDFVSYADKTFGRYLMGAILDSILVGVITIITLSLMGYKFAALIGLLVGLTNIIPFFGPFLGAIPSALIILIADGPVEMLIFVAFILVLQQIDGNIINPHIVGATTGLTPIGVIAAVTICSHIFGFIGMVIGVPLSAVLTYVVSNLVNKRLRKKNLPSDTDLYKNKNLYSNEAFIKASLAVEATKIIEKQDEIIAQKEAENAHFIEVQKAQQEIINARNTNTPEVDEAPSDTIDISDINEIEEYIDN